MTMNKFPIERVLGVATTLVSAYKFSICFVLVVGVTLVAVSTQSEPENSMTIGVCVGLVSGVVTSLVATCIAWESKKRELREKYGQCAGEYDGFCFKDERSAGEKSQQSTCLLKEFGPRDGKLEDQPKSEATVTYHGDNILKVSLRHDAGNHDKGERKWKREWKGTLTMETEDNGTLVWQYQGPEDGNQFGFKRCIWNREDKLYLVGEQMDGLGREVLVKRKPKKL